MLCCIDSKPRCKFEFVRCLKVYEKIISTDHKGTLAGPYIGRVPERALKSSFRVEKNFGPKKMGRARHNQHS